MAQLKMVAGKTYVAPTIFGVERVVNRGEVVDVSDEHAAVLLDDFYTDALGNQHFYFGEVGSEAAPEEVTAETAKPSRRRKAE